MREGKVANFDRVARLYATLERLTFGGALARRRLCFVADPRLARARRALVLGDGDGRFSAALLERYPRLQVTAVDSSPRMLAELTRRVASAAPNAAIDAQCADLRSWKPPHGVHYDLVTSHFLFDCLDSHEVAGLINRLSPAIARDARWLVSEFAVPPRGLGALIAPPLIRSLYFATRQLTGLRVRRLADYQSPLQDAGLSLVACETALGGVLRSELWEARGAVTATAPPVRRFSSQQMAGSGFPRE